METKVFVNFYPFYFIASIIIVKGTVLVSTVGLSLVVPANAIPTNFLLDLFEGYKC